MKKTETIKTPPECCEKCTNKCKQDDGACGNFRHCKPYKEWLSEMWNKIVRRFK